MIIYRTENLINKKFYYGVHNGNDPNYLGSGTQFMQAVKKYGRTNFKRRTIKEFDTAAEAYAFERILVDQQFIDNRNCYNVALGGSGGCTGERNGWYGKGQTGDGWDSWNAKIKSGEVLHPSIGKKWSKEFREKEMKRRNINNAITFRSITYPSMREASRESGISRYLIRKENDAQ